jgi:hypothetical protein
MSDEEVAAAAAHLNTLNVNRGTPPVAEKPYEGMDDDAVEAARRMIEGVNLGQTVSAGGEAAETAETRKQSFAERHLNLPPVIIDYWPGPHGTADDFADFPAKMEESDVLIVEGGGQDAQVKARILQEIADMDPAKYPADTIDKYIATNKMQGTQMEVVVRSIYGSRKAVGSFDVKGDDMALGKEVIASFKEVVPDYSLGSVDAVADDFSSKIGRTGKLQRQRELVIAGNAEPELERLFAERPELKEKTEGVKVLEPMGLTHINLREDLTGGDLQLIVQGEIPPPEAFTYREELMLQHMAGDTEPSRELKMKAYVEYVIITQLMASLPQGPDYQLPSSTDINAYVREAASHFDETAIKFVYRNQVVDPLTTSRMDRLLQQNGAQELPRTTAELKAASASIRAARATRQ